MKKPIARFAILCIVMLVLMGALIVQLGGLTLRDGAEYAAKADARSTRTISIKGMRGRILDKNGIVLAYSQTAYNVEFLRDADNRTQYYSAVYTEALSRAIEIIESTGGTTIDTSYIRQDENGNYYYDWGVQSEAAIKARYKNFCDAMGFTIKEADKDDMSKWISAEDAYLKLRESWRIPETMGFEDAVKIISIRQEVLLNNYRAYAPITIAYNVSMEAVAEIEMHKEELPGLQTSESYTRVYPKGTSAAHIIGYMGRSVTEEMIEEDGYDYSDYVGVYGIEATMEADLTGATREHQGSRIIEVNKNGTEIREISYTPATDGNDVMLTIDFPLQQKTEEALEHLIASISAKQKDLIAADKNGTYAKKTNGDLSKIDTAEGGSIIVMDVANGDVLAMASYPSYDPNWFVNGLTESQYEQLFGDAAAKSAPMRNKAISSKLAPGSIFKIVTGLAGLAEGVVGLNETIDDESPYYIVNPDGSLITAGAPKCWQKNTQKHANQDIVLALTNSCNYYFFEVANRLGIDKLNEWAAALGLTSSTGIELTGEAVGILGGQSVLYDNKAELSAQKTSMPSLIYSALCQRLRGYQSLRGVEIVEDEISSCAIKLMQLQDGSLANKGPDVRQILSKELGIPQGVTERTTWVSEIMSLLNELQWKPTLTIRSGIGQGVTLVTPIAIARYFSAIANGGTVYEAHIVDKVIDSDGVTVSETEPEVFNQINVDEAYWEAIREGLKGVVSPEDGGTASTAFSQEFLETYQSKIVGKTGTAQVGSNTIDIENTSWFVTYTPREDPEIAVVVCIPNGYSGSSSAAAVEEIVTYYYNRKESQVVDNLADVNSVVP